jgi:hypothetical protein
VFLYGLIAVELGATASVGLAKTPVPVEVPVPVVATVPDFTELRVTL